MNSIIIKGVQDELEIFEDRFTIRPRGVLGFLNKGLKGTKEIMFSSITAVQFKEAGIFNGYLQFTIPGGNESRGGIFAAVKDENTFIFTRQANDEVKRAKEFIQERVSGNRPTANTQSPSVVDEIVNLKKLLDAGAINEDEFKKMKTQLLKTAA
ncbi:SHOCT domain-containing protein [Bdellovibrionota bacterium FG-2]